MTDELDALRSFVPEAAGPTDDLIRTERSRFMALIENDPLTAPVPRRRRGLGRRTRIGLALACALVAVGGAAAGAGLIPNDVKEALGLVDDLAPATMAPDLDQAVKRAEAQTPDGTVELWTAPTEDGGACTYLRRLDASGTPGDTGAVGCVSLDRRMGIAMGKADTRPGRTDSMLGISGPLELQVQTATDGLAVAFGKATGTVATVVALDGKGREIGSGDVVDGWFVLSATGIATVEARDGNGRTLATIPLAKADDPIGSIPGKVVGGSSAGGAPAGPGAKATTTVTSSTGR